MVIQRIQTIWLFLAMTFMVCIGIYPISYEILNNEMLPIYTGDFAILMILDWLAIVLLFLSIFTFKKLKVQKTLSSLSIFMVLVYGVVQTIIYFNNISDATVSLPNVIFYILALIFSVLAFRGIAQDERKLRNSDRLWA